MDVVISKLLSNDNVLIKEATRELERALNSPDTLDDLYNIILENIDASKRQYAAMILRKYLDKLRNWRKMKSNTKHLMTQGILNVIVMEKFSPTRSAICYLAGTLMRHETDACDPWIMDMLNFIYHYCQTNHSKISKLASMLLAIITETAPDQFVTHLEYACKIFEAVFVFAEFNDDDNSLLSPVICNVIIAMSNLVPFIVGRDIAEQCYQKLLPIVIKSLKGFAANDDIHMFSKAFNILDNLTEYTPFLLTNYLIKFILEYCLEGINNVMYDHIVRCKCSIYITWLIRRKRQIFNKQMFEPVIVAIFNLMCSEPDGDDEEEDYFANDADTNLISAASHSMDVLALNLPPDDVIQIILHLVNLNLSDICSYKRRACLLSIAIITEGCVDTICNKYLDTFMNILCCGTSDSSPLVRNAAFFAMGQFGEHLQPDIARYAPEIFPILFRYLDKLCLDLKQSPAEPRNIDRVFYALRAYCENLGKDFVPYLPRVMNCVFDVFNLKYPVRVRELAFEAVTAAARAAQEEMLPYFQRLLNYLQCYLVPSDDRNMRILRSQAIGTLAELARTIGKENFTPCVVDTVNFAVDLIEKTNDPDERCELYNLFSALAGIVGTGMSLIYPRIIPLVFNSILYAEVTDIADIVSGVRVGPAVDQYEGAFDEGNHCQQRGKSSDNVIIYMNDDGENELVCITVENAYLQEREGAIICLKEFAQYTGAAFMPYVERAFNEVYKLIENTHEDVQKAAINALVAFLIAIYRNGDHNVDSVLATLKSTASILVTKLIKLIEKDDNITIVLLSLDGLYDLLKELKQMALPNDEITKNLFNCILKVFCRKTICQYGDDNNCEEVGDHKNYDDDSDDDCDEYKESEFDQNIVDSGLNLLVVFGEAMISEQYLYYYQNIFQHIAKRLRKTEGRGELQSQRSFMYSILCENIKILGKYIASLFDSYYSIMLIGLEDPNYHVRQHAVYGLGELFLHSKESSFPYYNQTLMALSNLIAGENKMAVFDNICGTIARLIIVNPNLVPLNEVFPVFLKYLPVKDDYSENGPILKCFQTLQEHIPIHIFQNIQEILTIIVHILKNKQYDKKDVCDSALLLLTELHACYPMQFADVISSSSDMTDFIQSFYNAANITAPNTPTLN